MSGEFDEGRPQTRENTNKGISMADLLAGDPYPAPPAKPEPTQNTYFGQSPWLKPEGAPVDSAPPAPTPQPNRASEWPPYIWKPGDPEPYVPADTPVRPALPSDGKEHSSRGQGSAIGHLGTIAEFGISSAFYAREAISLRNAALGMVFTGRPTAALSLGAGIIRHNVGALVVGEGAKIILDETLFRNVPTSTRTTIGDLVAPLVMFSPVGSWKTKAAIIVGTHAANSLLDIFENK